MMKGKYLLVLFCVVTVIRHTFGQSDDELPIPEEKDNQYPADPPPEPKPAEEEPVEEGSGIDIQQQNNATTPIEEEEVVTSSTIMETPVDSDTIPCPNMCACNQEGSNETYQLYVDCSDQNFVELPTPIDNRTTVLLLQNNRLTSVPKSISELKNLRVLNLNDNLITDFDFGSVSELPELRELKVARNMLLQIPQELKNSISLTKLEELDIAGNDIKEGLIADSFTHLTGLQKIILPSRTDSLTQELCTSLSKTLKTVCADSCDTDYKDCLYTPEETSDGYIAVLPNALAGNVSEENDDRDIPLENATTTVVTATDNIFTTDVPVTEPSTTDLPKEEAKSRDNKTFATEFSMHSAVVDTADTENSSAAIVDANTEVEKVGAKSSADQESGGVDKSVIGLIVAGMVVIVAGVTIKKNWSSIKKKFSSSPRPASVRNGNVNPVTPEEMPLQEKSQDKSEDKSQDKSPV